MGFVTHIVGWLKCIWLALAGQDADTIIDEFLKALVKCFYYLLFPVVFLITEVRRAAEIAAVGYYGWNNDANCIRGPPALRIL